MVSNNAQRVFICAQMPFNLRLLYYYTACSFLRLQNVDGGINDFAMYFSHKHYCKNCTLMEHSLKIYVMAMAQESKETG